MADITSISSVAHACTIVLHDPMLAIAWVRTVAGELTPDQYMDLFKALNPGDVDAVDSARAIVDNCMGTGI